MERRLAAIAFLDVVGYSRLMGVDEEGTLHEWSELRREVVEPRIGAWRGRIVDRAGDGIFVEFRSALDAFRWAVDVQNAAVLRLRAETPMQVRIALHLGDVIDGPEGEVQGDGVNTAARLQAYAEPGGVIVSHAVANEVHGKTNAVFTDLGKLHLKNISRPVHAFCLRSAAAPPRHRHGRQYAGEDAPGPVSAGNSSPRPSVLDMASAALSAKPVGAAPGSARPSAIPAVPGFLRARGPAKRGLVLAAGVAAFALMLVPPMLGRRSTPESKAIVTAAAAVVPPAPALTPRDEAGRLLGQGRAIGCPEQPCPREWLAARALYEQAIAVDPDYAPPYAEAAITYTNFVTSGLSLNEAEDRRTAERLATRAAALAPDQAFAHRARAAVLRLDPDRLEHALAAYLRVLSIEPNQPIARANAGWMLVLLGRSAEAEPFLRAALAVAPEHVYAPAWLTYLGLAELFLSREGHGAAHFRRALAQQSPSAAAADAGLQRGLNLAAALALGGDLEAARLVADELRRQHPAVSTRTLWNCGCSREPGFVSGLDKLRQGVMLAGVPNTR